MSNDRSYKRVVNFLVALAITVTFLLPASTAFAQSGGTTIYIPIAGNHETPSQPTQVGGPSPAPITLPDGPKVFAAPDGSSKGDGSQSKPWDLATALRKNLEPGTTLYLRGGKYGKGGSTKFTADLEGTRDKPIIVRSYPGEWAVVDGSITVNGRHTWFWGFEVTNTASARHVSPSDRPSGLNIFGQGTKVINMIISNTGHPGIGFWREIGDGGEVYGTIIYGVGLYDATTKEGNSNWTRGSAIYAQNQEGERLISDNITFRNWTTGMKAYTEGDYVNGFKFYNNVLFANNDRNIFASGRDHPINGLEMVGNMTYRPANDGERSLTVGYASADQRNILIKDNYVVNGDSELGALYVKRGRDITVTGNTLVSADNLVTYYKASSTGSITWDNNKYYDGSGKLFKVDDKGMDFNAWKSATGFDKNSTYSSSRPTSNVIFVKPNKYEPGRGHVVGYNWENRDSVQVDLSGLLQPGQAFRILDAQNIHGSPVVSGTYDGGLISLPMNLTAVDPIVGEIRHFDNVHTPKEFNVFVVLPR